MALVSRELLEILQCPETRTRVSLADDSLVARLNEAIDAGRIKNRGGDTMQKRVDGGLVRADAKVLYPIVDGIPIMLVDEAIALDQLSTTS